ncbi:peptide chain release factor N(5)-glutamine methyltransferase [Macromonas bipunctata]|uniref:peptide chain release factor N(5)-glutamine methyltransferase n=1 Tax=Macromonas bipunctata TaxID=183670 RepID=UPI000C31E3A9|nr:peptide chain release factor N(5)-glutamine methyltransferase [Macromonas bipunctata]
MSATPTVQTALQHARQQGLERLDAQVLLLHLLGRSPHDRAWLLAHDTDTLPADTTAAFAALCQRRLNGEPVAYLTGQREFYGLTLQVDARVLDPRPDTETLVDWALDVLADHAHPTVLDLGTGSGAIALALQQQQPDAHVWAVDASTDALSVAHANAQRLHLHVQFLQGYWLQGWQPFPAAISATSQPEPQGTTTHPATPPQQFDLIVSNPPYICHDDPHLAALTHEPLQALTSGADGLDDIRTIVAQATAHLLPSGWLLLEHGWDQADAVAALLQAHGYGPAQHRHDLARHVRCTGAQWPGAAPAPRAPPQG